MNWSVDPYTDGGRDIVAGNCDGVSTVWHSAHRGGSTSRPIQQGLEEDCGLEHLNLKVGPRLLVVVFWRIVRPETGPRVPTAPLDLGARAVIFGGGRCPTDKRVQGYDRSSNRNTE